jgi:hypothetical protein
LSVPRLRRVVVVNRARCTSVFERARVVVVVASVAVSRA